MEKKILNIINDNSIDNIEKLNKIKEIINQLNNNNNNNNEFLYKFNLLFKQKNPTRGSNKKDIDNKYSKFKKKYGIFAKEIIEKAIQYYIDNTDSDYIMKFNYFILKNDESQLMSSIDIIQEGNINLINVSIPDNYNEN